MAEQGGVPDCETEPYPSTESRAPLKCFRLASPLPPGMRINWDHARSILLQIEQQHGKASLRTLDSMPPHEVVLAVQTLIGMGLVDGQVHRPFSGQPSDFTVVAITPLGSSFLTYTRDEDSWKRVLPELGAISIESPSAVIALARRMSGAD